MELLKTLSAKEEGYPEVDRLLRHAVRTLLDTHQEARNSPFLESISVYQKPYTVGQISGVYRTLTRVQAFHTQLKRLDIVLPTQQQIDEYAQQKEATSPAKKPVVPPPTPTKNVADVERRKAEYFKLIASINLKGEIAPGLTLYKHQTDGIRAALYKERFIFADGVGVGKTLEGLVSAMARHNLYREDVYVVTTKSVINDWEEAAARINLPVTVISWDTMKNYGFGKVTGKYVVVVDEAHYMANEKAARTKAMLKLLDSPLCTSAFLLTATPLSNGEPLNMYSLLLAVHHPMVWSPDPKVVKEKYHRFLNRYYIREKQYIGKGKFAWKILGTQRKDELHRIVFYKPDDKAHNADDCCIIARQIDDCVDLPPKKRNLLPVEVDDAIEKIFVHEAMKSWEQYELNVKAKIAEFDATTEWTIDDEVEDDDGVTLHQKKLQAKEKLIRQAQRMVAYGIYRHAGAVAKLETTLSLALPILENGNKLVIFTSFTDIAKEIAARITKVTGKKVGVLCGEVKKDDRIAMKNDFQSEHGATQVIVSTAAGGEGITLTRAQYMIIIDRLWNPKSVTQWEGRIRRVDELTKKHEHIIIYWLQIPESIVDTDKKIDELIQRKQIDTDAIQFGKETDGMEFEDVDENADVLLKAMYERLKSRA